MAIASKETTTNPKPTMVTQSQAMAKRKAEGSDSEPPAKSSKSSFSDDSSVRRRKPATSRKPVKADQADQNLGNTRSRAPGKRKAEDEASHPPAKLAKVSLVGDSSTNRRKAPARNKKATVRGGKSGKVVKTGGRVVEDAPLSHISEDPLAEEPPAAPPSRKEDDLGELRGETSDVERERQNVEIPAEHQDAVGDSPSDGRKENQEQQDPEHDLHQDGSAPPGGEPDEGRDEDPGQGSDDDLNSQERAREEQRERDRNFARRVMQHLQLLLERERLTGNYPVPSRWKDQQLKCFTLLCDLVAENGHVAENRFLTRLPRTWWQDLTGLHGRLENLKNLQTASSELEDEVQRLSEAYDTIAPIRGDSYLGVGDMSKEGRRRLREELLQLREPFRQTRDKWASTSKSYENARDAVLAFASHLLRTAEKTLVYEKYLPRWDNREMHSIRESQTGAEGDVAARDLESLHTPVHSPYESQRDVMSDDWPASGDVDPAAPTRHAADARDNVPGPRREGLTDGRPKEDIIAEIREGQKKDLVAMELSYEQAQRRFDAVRDHYKRDLLNFVDKQRRNAVRGTRTDFDHKYFLARGKANRNVTAAKNEFEAVCEQIEATGVLHGSDGTLSDSAPTNEEGEGEGEREVHPAVQILLDLQSERVEAWRQAVADAGVASEAHWAGMVGDVRWEGDSLESSVQQPDEEDRLASGRRRRQIDGWRKEQERTRRENAFGVLPSTFVPAGAEVKWFEGWNGL